MDCEACTDRLVELLYEELPENDAESTRAHLEGCLECEEAFERISMGKALGAMLEVVDPPVSVLDSVMAVAREKAAQRMPVAEPASKELATPPRPETEEDDGAWSALLRWIGGFAMRPQLAMALSLFLMVGLGMWYLPTLRQGDPADSQAIVDPAPGDEVGHSASLEPAAPLELEANPRTGRILPREEPVRPTTPRAPRPTRPELAVTESPADEEGATPEPLVQLAQADLDDAPPSRPRLPEPTTESIEEAPADPRIAAAQRELAPGERARVAGTAAVARQPSRAGGQPSIAYEAPEPAAPPLAAAPEEASAGADRYERGLRRYRERNYRGAADDFESVIERPGRDTRRLIPSALHHLARSQRSAQNCAAAVRSYERLLRQHSSYSGVPEAMVESAACYERLGRLGDARRLLEQARTRPSVAARANRQLAVLAARERAAERVVPNAAAADAY